MSRLLFFAFLVALTLPAAAQEYEIDVQPLVLRDAPFSVTVRGADTTVAIYSARVSETEVRANLQEDGTLLAEGLRAPSAGPVTVHLLRDGTVVAQAETRSIWGFISIVPPFLAILIALAFKRVVPALFLGVWVGAWAAQGLSAKGVWLGLLDTMQVYVLNALANPDHAAIILFSLMIGGMVGIITKNGGMQGVVDRITGWARTDRRGQMSTVALGMAIFFDDYANTLVVGNTMRSVTDKLRISREKLAYLVDSTAAPIACLALVTTWIGYEVGLVGTAVAKIDALDESAYSIFLNSIPYSFYPLLAIFFVAMIAYTRRDFGPMHDAEVRARTTGQLIGPNAQVDEAAIDGVEMAPKAGQPRRPINAILPVLVLVAGVLGGLYATGEGDSLREIIGTADSYKALMWASLLGVLTAAVLSIGQRILRLDETVEAWYAGLKAMLFAMIILVLAWSLSEVTEVLRTADYLVSVLGTSLPAGVLPALIFVLAAATAFATGTSWGTMGILMPLVVPLVWAVLEVNGMADPAHHHILYASVANVLAGSVWGDHCSPISDTTILSSMASGCDHIDHVRTQLPYAVLVGMVAVLVGILPTGFGVPWWLSMIASVSLLIAFLRVFGKTVDAPISQPS